MNVFVWKNLSNCIVIFKRNSEAWTLLITSWILERTFRWVRQFKRLSKPHKILLPLAESCIMIVQSTILIRRLKKL